MFSISEEILIKGKETTYLVHMWDDKKLITSNELNCDYDEKYDEFQDIARLLQSVCEYLNSKLPKDQLEENKKTNWFKRLFKTRAP